MGTEGYGVPVGPDQYEHIAELAGTIAGKMVISVNDVPETRRVFAALRIDSVPIRYQVGGGDRAVERAELIIRSW